MSPGWIPGHPGGGAGRCPRCGAALVHPPLVLELPPEEADERMLAVARCGGCRFEGLTEVTESRHGDLSSESVHVRAHPVGPGPLSRLESWMRSCPSPRTPRCGCLAHRTVLAAIDLDAWGLLQAPAPGE